MPPADFMRSQRLKHAARLLAEDSDTNIADIAMKVGFVSASHFTKCFKQAYGVLPKEYGVKVKR